MRYLFDTSAWVWFFRKPTHETAERIQAQLRVLIAEEDIADHMEFPWSNIG